MAKIAKKKAAARAAFEGKANLSVEDAVRLVKDNATAKFDETVEIAMNLGVNPRHADQMVRGVVTLPAGTGKDVRVAVFARGPKADEAKEAGADIVGAEDLMETIQSGKIDFHYPWRARLRDSVNASNPVVAGDEVLISETYGPGSSLLKVRRGGYNVVWRDKRNRREKAMQTHWNTPLFHDGYLYASSGRHSNNAELRCIEWKTGKVIWSEPRLTRSSLLSVDGHFVCLSEDGALRLVRVNPKKFDQVATTVLSKTDPGPGRRVLKYPAWAAPILSHGLLYVRGKDRLVCLELISAR